MTLYEIDSGIMECFDPETGEVLDVEKLDALQLERRTKIEGVACAVKNLIADAAAYKAEKDAFAARQKQAERQAERLKDWLAYATGGEKMTFARAAVSFKSSERVEIKNEDLIPADFLVKKVTFTPDKIAIKERLKMGVEVEGCELVTCMNTQIK